jgi:hypothetical protein
MAFNEIAPAEMARMRAAVKPVYDKFSAEYDPAVVTLFKSELERVIQVVIRSSYFEGSNFEV